MGRKRASKNTHRALVLPTVVKPQPSNVRRSERIKSKSLVVSHPNTNCDIEVIEYITLSDGEKDEADTQLEHESELADNLGEKKSLEQKINCALQRIDALNKAVDENIAFCEAPFRSMYIDSQKKIKALTSENHRLNGKLENALGEN
ncbi:hypothetical protein JHK87_013346 [Glycine soja]|nr:hypothetical protein JHK87_013346 [Glycine soja]